MSYEQKNSCPLCRTLAPKTDKEVIKRVHKWVKKGKAWAQHDMGSLYDGGLHGLTQSHVMGFKLIEKAAQQGHPNAIFGLGIMYQKGQGTDPSPKKANAYFKMAAERGHANAQFNIGIAYFNGEEGYNQSFELAREWWTRAAAQGHKGGIASLKRFFEQRKGRENNDNKK